MNKIVNTDAEKHWILRTSELDHHAVVLTSDCKKGFVALKFCPCFNIRRAMDSIKINKIRFDTGYLLKILAADIKDKRRTTTKLVT